MELPGPPPLQPAMNLKIEPQSLLECLKEKEWRLQPDPNESPAHTFSEAPISAGPPSLNAWVLDRGSFSNNRNNGTTGLSEHRLHPIEEIASSSLGSLSINNSVTSSVDEFSNFHSFSTTYPLPVPSAPLLPDNAAWFTDAQPSLSSPLFPDNTVPESGYADWSSTYGP
ncbi:SMG7L protein [Spatholobus suberectus]|nr:SMG7L protein [Spatholobus suberectus]